MTLDIWAQASMFEHSQWTHFENPPTGTHANRNYVVALIMQVIGATGACAMGGCQHPCLSGSRPGQESTLMQAKTQGEMYQVVEHSLWVSGLVAIRSQAVLSLCSSESP